MVSMLIEMYVYLVRYEIHMHMYVLPVLLDPVSALDQFKGGPVRTRTRTIEDRSGPVLSGPVLVLEFSEDFRTGPDWTLKHYLRIHPDKVFRYLLQNNILDGSSNLTGASH